MLSLSPQCPVHGCSLHRASCRACNAAYMRAYYKERRRDQPAREMWERARKRAQRLGLSFTLPKDAITIPDVCPALGEPIRSTGKRSAQSPSLDRIRPGEGYVLGNIRVLSDYANRLKGNLSLEDIERRAQTADGQRQAEYERLAQYVRREQLLAEVRMKARTWKDAPARFGTKSPASWRKLSFAPTGSVDANYSFTDQSVNTLNLLTGQRPAARLIRTTTWRTCVQANQCWWRRGCLSHPAGMFPAGPPAESSYDNAQ